MHIKRQGQVLTKKIACLDSAFKGLDSLALVSAIKGQRLDGAIFFISTACSPIMYYYKTKVSVADILQYRYTGYVRGLVMAEKCSTGHKYELVPEIMYQMIPYFIL